MAAMNPSPTKPVVRYPTALLEDKELVTIHDSRLPDYKALEYGTLYPDQNKFPGLKLIFQEPLDDDRMVRRVWAGDRKDQDLYNADRKYSGGSTEHPILIRRYLFPEDGYEPLATGTPDSQFPEAVLVEEEVAQPENRNGYLAVTRVFETLPGPLLTGVQITEKGQVATITTQVVEPGTTVTPSALVVGGSVKPDSKGKSVLEKIEVPEVFSEKSFSIENPDPVPPKFRIAIPSTTEEETVEGVAAQPVLGTAELAKSEQQITKFTKRKRKTSRDVASLPKSLTQILTTNVGLKASVTETLQVGDASDNPTAVLSVESEAVGDGTYIVRKTTLPEVFDEKAVSFTKPDVVPEKFRAAVPTNTIQEVTAASSVSLPTPTANQLQVSLERVSAHTVRKVETTRNIGNLSSVVLKGQQQGVWGVEKVEQTIATSEEIAPAHGVKDAQTDALETGLFLKTVQNYPDSPAELIELRTDEETGIRIESRKSLVNPSSHLPVLADGESIERQAIDKWHSVQIVSKLHSSLPSGETYTKLHPISLPDILVGAGVYWDYQIAQDTSDEGLNNQNDPFPLDVGWSTNASAEATAEVIGSGFVQIKQGFRGKAFATVTRTYHQGPPGAQEGEVVRKFEPVLGQLIVRNVKSTKSGKSGFSGKGYTALIRNDGSSTSFRRGTQITNFGPVEHNSPALLNVAVSPVFTGPPPTGWSQYPNWSGFTVNDLGAYAWQKSGTNGGKTPDNVVASAYAEATSSGSATLVLPLSSTPLASGTTYIEDIEVSKWRFGIWVREKIVVTVP